MPGRRGNNEGTIYKRKDSTWCAQITLPNGKRKTKYAKSQKEARDWMVEQQNANRQGTWSDALSITMSEFLERYMSDVMANTLRPKTQETYTILIRTHLQPAIGRIKLIALRPEHLQKLYADELTAGKSRRTVQHIHAVIHKALTHAVKWGLVVRNVADAVDVPRPQHRPPELLTEAQAKVFLDSVKSDPLYPLWLLAITTGMRKEEVQGLRWSDCDLEGGVIHISQVAQTVYKKGIIISEPKTEKSRRSIDLPAITVEALRQHREAQKRYEDFEAFEDQGLVFCTKRGTPFGSRNLLTYFHKALAKAGLPKVRFHSLRHLHATMLLAKNLHPKLVQERLGHSRIDITLDVYSHVLKGMGKQAAVEMDKIFTA